MININVVKMKMETLNTTMLFFQIKNIASEQKWTKIQSIDPRKKNLIWSGVFP